MSRFYDINGTKKVSVTTFLSVIGKPFLLPWAVKMEREKIQKIIGQKRADALVLADLEDYLLKKPEHVRYMEKASSFGNLIHTTIESEFRGNLPPPQTDASKVVMKVFRRWWRHAGYKPLEIEQTVYVTEPNLDYAGTMDIRARKGRKIFILDWKTGKGIWSEHFLQNTAYRYAAEKRDLPSDGGVLIHIPHDGTEPLEIPVDEKWFNMGVVRWAFRLWQWHNETEKKLRKDKQRRE